MTCERIHGVTHNGEPVAVTICVRGKRWKKCAVAGCGRDEAKLCDYPLQGKKEGKTCDRPLCDSHATNMGDITRVDGGFQTKDTVDFCPQHAAMTEPGSF